MDDFNSCSNVQNKLIDAREIMEFEVEQPSQESCQESIKVDLEESE